MKLANARSSSRQSGEAVGGRVGNTNAKIQSGGDEYEAEWSPLRQHSTRSLRGEQGSAQGRSQSGSPPPSPNRSNRAQSWSGNGGRRSSQKQSWQSAVLLLSQAQVLVAPAELSYEVACRVCRAERFGDSNADSSYYASREHAETMQCIVMQQMQDAELTLTAQVLECQAMTVTASCQVLECQAMCQTIL